MWLIVLRWMWLVPMPLAFMEAWGRGVIVELEESADAIVARWEEWDR